MVIVLLGFRLGRLLQFNDFFVGQLILYAPHNQRQFQTPRTQRDMYFGHNPIGNATVTADTVELKRFGGVALFVPMHLPHRVRVFHLRIKRSYNRTRNPLGRPENTET